MKNKFFESFDYRHIGPRDSEISSMLKVINSESVDQLINEIVPENILLRESLNIGEGLSETNYLKHIKTIAEKNTIFRSLIGMGYYSSILPTVIQRNVFENPGWYTQYTPYQAEISQGRLEALLNFQTLVSDLTGLPVANASLLDEGTAAAEAVLMLKSLRKDIRKNIIYVSESCFPQTIDVLKTRINPHNIQIKTVSTENLEFEENVFALLLQYPDVFGNIEDYSNLIVRASQKNIKVIIAADLLSLTLLKSPGQLGADIAVGTTQRFGVPLGYGGPHAAYFAVKDEYKRVIPGRIIGVSIDNNGNRALRMALQTREQHIRRDKATSNICTSQVLLAILSSMYAVYHGPEGLKKIANRIHSYTVKLNENIEKLGFKQQNDVYFDTLRYSLSREEIKKLREVAEREKFNFNYFFTDNVLISLDERTDDDEIKKIFKIFSEAKQDANITEVIEINKKIIPDSLMRTDKYLTHEVFNKYHSEHEMLRYIKRLESKDLSLTTSMIPLGSCTMKLNATTEMIPVTWTEFAEIHPFVPLEQSNGYQELFRELEKDLANITGFCGVSLQPNSGAQGEYTGLMVIREYFKDKGETNRNVVLIPASAHGTNPASAVMAGMKVVVVNCDEKGNIDISDLRKKATEFSKDLAAIMVTYPSTHGVFESSIKDVCNIVHENGGQVYMDGANMNAQVCVTSPKEIGADVCHLNLHKTFSIPHGGGGPGVGPIAVAEHLVPFLPGHSLIKIGGSKAISAVSSAPWGSAGVLMISYGYIKMMGYEGLKKATQIALLNANYIKSRLEKFYKVLYSGERGRVAHELIFDVREFKHLADIDVEDIAKRLMDYGFHAPTVSFPVPGTLMVEPTESESKYELDRFCDAMIMIKKEIDEIISGKLSKEDNPLKNAPHTAFNCISDNWQHQYSRERAAYPAHWSKEFKFWPSVGRINNAYGDRNLVCSCEPISSYIENN